MRRGTSVALVVACAAAACGKTESAAPFVGGIAPRETGPRLRLLDPGGRLYAFRADPMGFVRPNPASAWEPVDLPEGIASWSRDTSALARGSELAIVVPGCRVERVVIDGNGEQIVRLRRGLPVRLKVDWDGALPEGLRRLGVSLERPFAPEDGLGAGGRRFRSAGADAMDRDLPEPRDWTPVPSSGDVTLYVPEPGTYAVAWKLDAHNWGSGTTGRPSLAVAESGPTEPVVVTPPVAWMENAGRSYVEWRDRK
jgi:hypothetical protein